MLVGFRTHHPQLQHIGTHTPKRKKKPNRSNKITSAIPPVFSFQVSHKIRGEGGEERRGSGKSIAM